MKRVIAFALAAALLLSGMRANAQLVPGFGYLYASETSTGIDGSTSFHGFYLGASYNIPLAAGLGVAPGLYASFLGHNEIAATGSPKIGYNVMGDDREFAVNIPVKITYSLDFGNDRGLIAYAGPVFQIGLTNTTQVSGTVSFLGINYGAGSKVDNYDAEKGTMNRFNVYLGGGVGVQLGDVIFHIGYDHSLMDIDKSTQHVTSRGQLKIGAALSL